MARIRPETFPKVYGRTSSLSARLGFMRNEPRLASSSFRGHFFLHQGKKYRSLDGEKLEAVGLVGRLRRYGFCARKKTRHHPVLNDSLPRPRRGAVHG